MWVVMITQTISLISGLNSRLTAWEMLAAIPNTAVPIFRVSLSFPVTYPALFLADCADIQHVRAGCVWCYEGAQQQRVRREQLTLLAVLTSKRFYC